ncbi:unnamed protein product [Candidula unifasciata]|uniref:Calcineurin-like phosphoesterase domain-containing protein n=1 Tax=Candidula unifasciata TaxID=100452 RepID=A0A8S3ZVR4_9EUPU|nr:unnamed protein product [Candidula unifasciata]
MIRMRCIVVFIVVGIALGIGISTFFSSLDPGRVRGSGTDVDEYLRSSRKWSSEENKIANIFWIVQIWNKFCEEYLSIIKPEVVLISGDLTDAKTPSGIGSRQIRDEWIIYENSVKKCHAYSNAKWLDLRGNHDSFDVFDFGSKNNYYKLHSVHGSSLKEKSDFESGFIHKLEMPFGTYSFIGIDTCSRPGPNRPFNFFGYLDDKQIQHIKSLEAASKGSNHTVWFGHFPTSLIVHNPPVLRQIMSSAIAYLCGHLHTLNNLVPKMYSRHKTGQLELELGDWKDNRIFRVMAFDHDLMSFTDAKLGTWPIVIITNPKNNQFYSPHEPLELIASSTLIRILIFSHVKIKQVEVKIDKQLEGYAYQVDPNHPLYELPWSPVHFASGTHTIEVFITDAHRMNTTVSQHFSVDGSEMHFDFVPRLILMLNIYSAGKLIFSLLVFFYALVLTSLRQFTYIRVCYLHGRVFVTSFVNAWIMKLWLAARSNVSYYILIGSVLYLTFGPWFVGYLLSDKIGVVFVWGILVEGTFLPGGITYFYGIFQFLMFNVPLTLILGHLLDTRRKHGHKLSLGHHLSILIPVGLLQVFTIYLVLTEFPRAYGQTSLLLGPLRTGSTLLLPLSVLCAYRTDLKHLLAVNGPT